MTARQIDAIVQQAVRLKPIEGFPLLALAGCIAGLVCLACLGLFINDAGLLPLRAILVLAPLANLAMAPLAALVIIKNARKGRF
jgi:hypothetical protein